MPKALSPLFFLHHHHPCHFIFFLLCFCLIPNTRNATPPAISTHSNYHHVTHTATAASSEHAAKHTQLPLESLCHSPSLLLETNVDTDSMHAQQGCKKCQHYSSVGSVDPLEASKGSRNVMASFKFLQESPPYKSAPPSPTQ
jgi:hypothetical protein